MFIMTQDRVSGLASEKSPLRTYGPGNTRDESNRNSWVSSDGSDKLSVNCFGQVNGLFLGRYQADEVLLTYQGDEIYSNMTSGGYVGVGYANATNGAWGVNGVIPGYVSAISSTDGTYFYSGTLVTITCYNDTKFVNVGDLIEISGTNTNLDGFHKIVLVQEETSFSKLDKDENTSFYVIGGETGTRIQVVLNEDLATVTNYLPLSTYLEFENGISITLLSGGLAGSVVGTISDENDIALTYEVTFTYSPSDILKSGDPVFTVGEYISFDDCVIRSLTTTSIVAENLSAVSNEFKKYLVIASNPSEYSFTVLVKPTSFYSKVGLTVVTLTGNPKVNFGSTFIYDGGSYQHKLGLSLISGDATNVGTETYKNNEYINLENPIISTNADNRVILSSDQLNQLKLNETSESNLHKTYIKNRRAFSIRLPFKFVSDVSNSFTSFEFSSTDSINLRKYVVDTTEAATTTAGAGTPIRRIDVATKTQNSVSDFVTGRLLRVESSYIQLPREAFPTRITLELNSTINHNAANLFNQFLLEEVDVENPNSSNTDNPVTIEDPSDYSSYSMSCSAYKYNNESDGKLTLFLSSNSSLEVNDYIYLSWPNTIAAQNSDISFQLTSNASDHTATAFRVNQGAHMLYEGMSLNNSSNLYINSINYTSNLISTNIAHGLTAGSNVTFNHHSDLSNDASEYWTGIHRVVDVQNSGSEISIFAPNAGTNGDLTINNDAYSQQPSLYNCSDAFIVKVTNGKGRFVRPIVNDLQECEAFLWNSGLDSDGDVEYTHNGVRHYISPGYAKLIFSEPHSLVNNDKIVLYGLNLSTTGGQHMKGLESSYLVTYSTSSEVLIEIEKASFDSNGDIGMSISSLQGAETSDLNYYDLLVITVEDHKFSVGDKITLNGLQTVPVNYNGQFIVKTTPTSKSFTISVGSDVGQNPSFIISGNERAISGVHYLSTVGGSAYTNTFAPISNISCSRSVSISDAISSFENPIEVGNLIYRDAYQFSSGQYDAVNNPDAKFLKTPNIDDASSTTPYRSDSSSSIQNTFIGTEESVVSQINLIRGDATTEKDIHLSSPFGSLGVPYTFTKLLQALRVAILRAGVSKTLPNPSLGVTNTLKDFSVRKELPTGAYYYLNRDAAKEFSGKLTSSPDNIDLLMDFAAEQLARPFPCLVISSNECSNSNVRKLRTRAALYGYFTALPSETYNNKQINLKEASFSIREVL